MDGIYKKIRNEGGLWHDQKKTLVKLNHNIHWRTVEY